MKNFKKNIYLCVFGGLLFVKCTPSINHMKLSSSVIKKSIVINNDSDNSDKEQTMSNNEKYDNMKSDNNYLSNSQLGSNSKHISDFEENEDEDEENKEDILFEKTETGINGFCENETAITSSIEYKVYERSVYANKNKLSNCKERVLLETKITVTRFRKNSKFEDMHYCKKPYDDRDSNNIIGKYAYNEICSYDYELGKEVIQEKEIIVILNDTELKKYKGNKQFIAEKRYICNKISLDSIVPDLKEKLSDLKKEPLIGIKEKNPLYYLESKIDCCKNDGITIKNESDSREYLLSSGNTSSLSDNNNVNLNSNKYSMPGYYNIMSCREISVLVIGLQFGFIFSAFYFDNFK